MRIIFFTLLCALAPLAGLGIALADEADDSYLLYFSDIGQKLPIGVLPKAECAATLETAFNPEETIASGLNTLDAAKNQSTMQSCLTELVSTMSSDTGSGAFSLSLPRLEAGKVENLLAEFKRKKNCYNPNKPGSSDFESYKNYYGKNCEGKWLSEEESKKTLAEYQEINRFNSLIKSVPDGMVDQHEEDRKQINELDDRIDTCGPNPYTKDDGYYYKNYAKNQDKKCKKIFSATEISAMKKKLHELNEKYEKTYQEAAKAKQRFTDALQNGSYVADEIFDRRKELLPLARAVACISPYAPGSSDDKDWKSERKEAGYCEDKFGSKSDLPKARAKLVAALGDLDQLTARNKAAKAEALKQQNLKLLGLSKSQTQRYAYRRLFANYKGYFDRTSEGGSISEFCTTYEAETRRDAKFSRMNMPGEGNINIYSFKDGKGWQHAQYGLTEAEYKAMTMYVGSFYRRINEPLWKHEALNPELALYKEVLDSALKKLPTLPGSIPLKRHLMLPQASIDAHKLNEIITYDSYTSTSKSTNWNWSGNAKMIIYGGKNSKDVSKYNESEQEVIFLPGTRFKVIGKETNGGTTNFVLGEVDDKGDLVARLPAPKDWTP